MSLLDRSDREVIYNGEVAGYIQRFGQPGGAPHWQFFADPGGDNYRKYLSFKPAGALSHLHGIESFDLAALERFLSAGGELAGWQVITKNHFGGYRELVAL